MNHQRYDWEALRGVPLEILLREDGFSERQIRGVDDCACPFHPDSNHARFSPDHNHIHCWSEGKNASPLDYVMARDGVDLFAAAERIADAWRVATDLLPQGTPLSRDFWESPTIDELADSQHVQPLADVRTLFGTWPGESDDGFEAAIDDLRHREMSWIVPALRCRCKGGAGG